MPTTSAPFLTALSTDAFAALTCPGWCVEPSDHGLTDRDITVSGGVWREHHSAETVVAGLRVRIAQGVDYSLDHGLIVTPPTVQMAGCSEADLVQADAHQLATVISEHATSLTAVQA